MPKSIEQKRREAAERQLAYDLKFAPVVESEAAREVRMSASAQRRLDSALQEPLSRPVLVQRASIIKPYTDMSSTKFGAAVDLDYMGASEFEDGSTGISLRVLQARSTQIRVNVHPTIIDSQARPLLALHVLSDKDLDTYNGYLTRLHGSGEPIRTKERTKFEAVNMEASTDLWWDIRNHVIWSFDHHFMMSAKKLLEQSWKAMNEDAMVS